MAMVVEKLERIKLRGETPEERLMNYVEDRGGEIALETYSSMEQIVWVRCGKNHSWWIRASKLVSDQTWCRRCGVDRRRLGIDRANEIARERGGRCLSTEYQNVHTLMEWRCKHGHRFSQTINEITHKDQWCPECRVDLPRFRQSPRTFEHLLRIAAIAGIVHTGRARALHRNTWWKCRCGYEWKATGQAMLKRKAACLACAGKAPVTIETLREWARKKGGLCLSSEYVNNYTPVEWECGEGHRWWAKWKNVGPNGTWCPKCVRPKDNEEPGTL